MSTKDVIVTAAMELFGRQGYHATTVAQIEDAAGLSAGAGGLYRHFKSKRAVLEEGLDRRTEASRPLSHYLTPADLPGDRFLALGRAALRRLEQERDVNRLLLCDLASFPDLLEQVRDRELRRDLEAVTEFVHRELPAAEDPEALAAVLTAAISHYWIMADVFGGRHPHGIDAERYLGTLMRLVVGESLG